MKKFIAAFVLSTIAAFSILLGADIFLVKLKQRPSVTRKVASNDPSPDKDFPVISRATLLKLYRVTVRVRSVDMQSGGTGVVIWSGHKENDSSKFFTYVITCSHVVHQAKSMVVEKFNYFESKVIHSITFHYSAVVMDDPSSDIAIIEVVDDAPFADVAELVTPDDLSRLSLGENCYVVGCPNLQEPTLTRGEVSSFNYSEPPSLPDSHIRITAPITFGNSGGGIFTADGKLLGIARAMTRMPDGQVYNHAGFGNPVWRIYVRLVMAGYGFTVKAEDGSTLEKMLEAREALVKEAAKKAREQFEKEKLEKETRRILKFMSPDRSPGPPDGEHRGTPDSMPPPNEKKLFGPKIR